MPEDIQLNFLRMIQGLENVDMLKPGKILFTFFFQKKKSYFLISKKN